MTTDTALAPTTDDARREVALLKAIGFDRLAPEQREIALHLANKYQLDPMLRHIVVIDGRPVLTRDALLHIAHRSGVIDGIQTTTPVLVDGFWRCTATVWRKDWSHPIEYPGRFPDAGRKGRATEYAEEMAIKCAESMALRRAFDVAAPIAEERWDTEVPVEPPAPRPTLAERAAQRAAEVTLLAEPMTPEASARYANAEEVAEGAAPIVREGLTVAEFAKVARDNFKGKAAIAKVIGCEVAQVVDRLEAMSDAERGVVADELNLDWRTP